MITVTVEKNDRTYVSFTSEGHAGYAEEGHDIVCAAVSALIISTVNSLELLTGDRFGEEDRDGFVRITFTGPLSKGGTLLMDSLILGLKQIENSYPDHYLKVNVREV